MSTARSEPVFTGGGRTRALTVRRSARARRVKLSVRPGDGEVRLTLPARAALKAALAWAESQRGWVEAALAKLPAAQPLGPGASLPFRGAPVTIAWTAAAPRQVRLEGATLAVGGPAELVPGRVLRWLKAEAARVLEAETRTRAAQAGITVGRVRVGDARTRWGSCSSTGDIAYSWRLILAPPGVLEATVAHELAHRLHMDHGPYFHAAVEALLGRSPAPEHAWLKANAALLHNVGR